MSETWTIPRESREWVGPLTVTTGDGELTTAYEVAVVPALARPTAWSQPDVLEGRRGVTVGPGSSRLLAPGVHHIWIRVVDDAESPVLDRAGTIRVT